MRTKKRAISAGIRLRLPMELRGAIETAAKMRGVSMNTEMVEQLTAAYEMQPDKKWARGLSDREWATAYLSIIRGLETETGSFPKALERVEELHRHAKMNVDSLP